MRQCSHVVRILCIWCFQIFCASPPCSRWYGRLHSLAHNPDSGTERFAHWFYGNRCNQAAEHAYPDRPLICGYSSTRAAKQKSGGNRYIRQSSRNGSPVCRSPCCHYDKCCSYRLRPHGQTTPAATRQSCGNRRSRPLSGYGLQACRLHGCRCGSLRRCQVPGCDPCAPSSMRMLHGSCRTDRSLKCGFQSCRGLWFRCGS